MPYLLFNENGNRNYIQLERDLMLTLDARPTATSFCRTVPDPISVFTPTGKAAGSWRILPPPPEAVPQSLRLETAIRLRFPE